jgi:hypothetical protein
MMVLKVGYFIYLTVVERSSFLLRKKVILSYSPLAHYMVVKPYMRDNDMQWLHG